MILKIKLTFQVTKEKERKKATEALLYSLNCILKRFGSDNFSARAMWSVSKIFISRTQVHIIFYTR